MSLASSFVNSTWPGKYSANLQIGQYKPFKLKCKKGEKNKRIFKLRENIKSVICIIEIPEGDERKK